MLAIHPLLRLSGQDFLEKGVASRQDVTIMRVLTQYRKYRDRLFRPTSCRWAIPSRYCVNTRSRRFFCGRTIPCPKTILSLLPSTPPPPSLWPRWLHSPKSNPPKSAGTSKAVPRWTRKAGSPWRPTVRGRTPSLPKNSNRTLPYIERCHE